VRYLIVKFTLALTSGLTLTLTLLGLMTYLNPGLPEAQAAGPHHVAPNCAGIPFPCYTNIQAAVDAATPGDVIKVATGTYTGVSFRAGVTQTVFISKNVTIRGGYTTAFSEPPDPQANPTTLDAQGQGRVFFITGTISLTIEGLRITGGNANGVGGLPLITAEDAGGGVLIILATVIFNNNHVIGNTAFDGGGLFLWQGTGTLNNNLFATNTAVVWGGGVVLYSSTATVNGNTILANTANNFAGLIVFDSNDVTFINNMIANNHINSIGLSGSILIGDSSVRILHNTIAHNTGGNGNGIFVSRASVALTNTILVSQTVGITVTADSTATLESTLWNGNTINWGGAGLITSTNNYTGNPAFIDPDDLIAPNFHISSTSAAIDKGVNAGVTSDIDGEVRPHGAGYELGADEFLPASIPLSEVIINGPTTGTLNTPYIFTATISPSGATPPITYTWSPLPDSGQGTAIVTYTWPTTGIKTIIVTATNTSGVATDSHDVALSAPILTINKSGPTIVTASSPITYTLAITNSGNLTATNLVITDTIPAGAHYISGGTKVGNVISWTVSSLAANGGIAQATFVVTATQTITNSDYSVTAEGGYRGIGNTVVVTKIRESFSQTYLPLILK
jgi:uncharacterized repeat protein (TIGR01451 family)